MAEGEQRVTPLELFFDLVFVFAITQVTGLMSADPTWEGLVRGLLIFAALWWAWAAYAWLTNTLEPEAIAVRVAMVAAMAAMLLVALSVPGAFNDDALLFGIAYFAVRVLHLVLYAIAGKGTDVFGAVLRMTPSSLTSSVLIIGAALLDGLPQGALWLAALAIDYLGVLVGRGQGWAVSPAHFAERHGLIVIVALGESIVAIGVGAAELELGTGEIVAAVLGIGVVAALWWAYFDVQALLARRSLSEARGRVRAELARDYYSYLHMPMVAGIVLFAMGLKKTLEHVGDPLATVPAVALCGGLGLYFGAHVAHRIRLLLPQRNRTRSLFGPGRTATTVAMLALIPAALEAPALAALAFVFSVCVALIVYDVLRYREERLEVRAAR